LSDQIKIHNFCFVHDSINNKLPTVLNTFKKTSDVHSYNTQGSLFNVQLPTARTAVFGIHSIRYESATIWNIFVNQFPNDHLHTKSKALCKAL